MQMLRKVRNRTYSNPDGESYAVETRLSENCFPRSYTTSYRDLHDRSTWGTSAGRYICVAAIWGQCWRYREGCTIINREESPEAFRTEIGLYESLTPHTILFRGTRPSHISLGVLLRKALALRDKPLIYQTITSKYSSPRTKKFLRYASIASKGSLERLTLAAL